MRYRIVYLAYPSADSDARPTATKLKEKTFSVPWFWLAYLVAFTMKNTWEQGGTVTDTKTGKVRISWELSGTVFGDGRAHLTVDGVLKGRVGRRLAAMAKLVDAAMDVQTDKARQRDAPAPPHE